MNKLVWILVFLFFVCASCQEYSVKCNESDNKNKSLTFEPADDGVEGRYKVELCTQADNETISWDISLRFYNNRTSESCKQFNSRLRPGIRHSHKTVNFVVKDLKCTNICMSTYLDLIFNATCYRVSTSFKHSNYNSAVVDALFYVTNPYPMSQFTNSTTLFSYQPSDNKDLAIWYLGFIPATGDTAITLCIPDNLTKVEECQEIDNNCTIVGVKKTEMRCEITPSINCYVLHLKHRSPWSGSRIFENVTNAKKTICAVGPSTPTIQTPGKKYMSGAIHWAGAAVTIIVAALMLLMFARWRHLSELREKVESLWPPRNRPPPPPKPVVEGSRVLLIYARDCQPFMHIVELLKVMLQQTGCQVVDIFSAEAVAMSAPAPGEWLRRLAADPGTRLLLLQAPAAAALYTSQLTQGEPHLSAPLLGRVAVRRQPHPADCTAMLALRMLGEAAARPLAYRKCYVATIEGLESELVPGVTPHRRYVLPAYTEVLLRDLTPGSNAAELHNTQRDPNSNANAQEPNYTEATKILEAAIDDLIDYVRKNPDYLTDELLFI